MNLGVDRANWTRQKHILRVRGQAQFVQIGDDTISHLKGRQIICMYIEIGMLAGVGQTSRLSAKHAARQFDSSALAHHLPSHIEEHEHIRGGQPLPHVGHIRVLLGAGATRVAQCREMGRQRRLSGATRSNHCDTRTSWLDLSR